MIFSLYQILGWGRSMGSLRGTIPCSFKRKIGGQLWCLILAKRKSPVFRAKKKLETLSLREFRQISVGKKKSSNRRVERVVLLPSKLKRKKMKKKKHTSFLKYRRKNKFALAIFAVFSS